MYRVSIAGLLVCPPEDIIIVSENDASRTFEVLQQLLREETTSQGHKLRRLRNGLSKPEVLREILRLDDSILNPILAS
jgi:hypothetical protein